MADLIKDGADEVVARINAGSYSYADSFTAARAYAPSWDKTELQTVKVSVVPRTLVVNLESRSSDRELIDIQVAVQKAVDPAAVSDVDALMLLVEEIRLQLRRYILPTTPQLNWTAVANDPIYDPAMRENRIFTSVLTLTYAAFR